MCGIIDNHRAVFLSGLFPYNTIHLITIAPSIVAWEILTFDNAIAPYKITQLYLAHQLVHSDMSGHHSDEAKIQYIQTTL